MEISVVIIAGGYGTRMHSRMLKVLHKLSGKPILSWVIETVKKIKPIEIIIVYGFNGKKIIDLYGKDRNLKFIKQSEINGTASAVKCAIPYLKSSRTLIFSSDVPFVNLKTLFNFLKTTPDNCMGILTADVKNSYGFGRILRDENFNIIKIVEESEINSFNLRNISEVNLGTYLIPTFFLKKYINLIDNNNFKNEYYFTDIINIFVENKIIIYSVEVFNEIEIVGINNRKQLIDLERLNNFNYIDQLLKSGVTIIDPSSFNVRGSIDVGSDVFFDANIVLKGVVIIGNNVKFGSNIIIKNSVIGNNVRIFSNSVIENSVLCNYCTIGPFSNLRNKSFIDENAKIGSFVETKNIFFGKSSKANHLSYMGDSYIGKNVNFGSNSSTCNYDGTNKYCTIIDNYSFIGSGAQLIAPVIINKGSFVAAGTTLLSNTFPGKLTLNYKKQKTLF